MDGAVSLIPRRNIPCIGKISNEILKYLRRTILLLNHDKHASLRFKQLKLQEHLIY